MAYKPPTKKSSFVRGPSGAALVAFSPDGNKIKVTFDDEEFGSMVLQRSECPDVLLKGKCFVSLTDKKDKMLSARPLNGVVRAKVKEFVAEKEKEPAPKLNDKVKYPYTYFMVLITITKGNWKDAIIPCMFHYNFYAEKVEIDGKERDVVGFDHAGSKATPPLIKFFDAAGVWDKGAMPYKDNILPMVAKRIKEADKEFDLVIENGYATSFLPLDDVSEESGLKSEPIPEE